MSLTFHLCLFLPVLLVILPVLVEFSRYPITGTTSLLTTASGPFSVSTWCSWNAWSRCSIERCQSGKSRTVNSRRRHRLEEFNYCRETTKPRHRSIRIRESSDNSVVHYTAQKQRYRSCQCQKTSLLKKFFSRSDCNEHDITTECKPCSTQDAVFYNLDPSDLNTIQECSSWNDVIVPILIGIAGFIFTILILCCVGRMIRSRLLSSSSSAATIDPNEPDPQPTYPSNNQHRGGGGRHHRFRQPSAPALACNQRRSRQHHRSDASNAADLGKLTDDVLPSYDEVVRIQPSPEQPQGQVSGDLDRQSVGSSNSTPSTPPPPYSEACSLLDPTSATGGDRPSQQYQIVHEHPRPDLV